MAAVWMPASALAGKPGNNFVQLAADMTRFYALGILQGDYERGVAFNAALAKQYGFSESAIRLGEQVAAATNDLITRVKKAQGGPTQVTEVSFEIERYPDLQQFWLNAATQSSQRGLGDADFFEKGIEPLGVPGASHIVCGYYPNPKPSTNGPWTTHRNISNPAATLRSWGTMRRGHQTILAGDGQDLRRTSLFSAGGVHIEITPLLQVRPPSESRTTRGPLVENLTQKSIDQAHGHIQIGPPMSTGGTFMGLDADAQSLD